MTQTITETLQDRGRLYGKFTGHAQLVADRLNGEER
jgi:hypothetical protein